MDFALDYSAVRNSGMVFEGPGDCLQGPDDDPYIAIHDRAWVEMGRRTGKRCMSSNRAKISHAAYLNLIASPLQVTLSEQS